MPMTDEQFAALLHGASDETLAFLREVSGYSVNLALVKAEEDRRDAERDRRSAENMRAALAAPVVHKRA